MKKTLLLVLLTTLILISCQKESDVLPKGNNANYYVENGILNVKNQTVLDSLVAANLEKSEEEVVAWSDSLGFKSLASVYKDAEKEKDALTVEELKAKYEGKLVFNTENGAEKEFTCAVENIGMAGLVDEDGSLIIAFEKKNFKNVSHPSFQPKALANLKGSLGSTYAASFSSDHKRWFYVRYSGLFWSGHGISADHPETYSWALINEVRSEKKVWGGWIGYSTSFWGRLGSQAASQLAVYNGNNPGIFKHIQPYGSVYKVWTGGVPEAYAIKIVIDINGVCSITN